MATPTLRFDDPALEARFDAEYRGDLRHFRLVVLAILAFMVAISVTGLLVEFSVNRGGIQRLLWFAMIPCTAVAALLLHLDAGAARPQRVVLAYVAAMGAICALFPRLNGDVAFAADYGFSYTAFFSFLVFPLSRLAPLRAAALVAGVAALYGGASATLPGLQPSALGPGFALIAGAAALGFALGYLMESNQRRALAARADIEARERRVAAEYEGLRRSVEPAQGDDGLVPYTGEEPFVFVSYRRDDLERVRPILHRVQGWGYRIWYDRGIPGGAEWDALIEERLKRCAMLLFFVSRGSVESKYCRREVKYVDQLNKPILSVRLEPAELTHGLEMLLTQYQIVDATADNFAGEMERALRYQRLL